MPKVLVLNNYSFERVWREVRAGDKPDHHLFGLNYFEEAGYEIEIIPFRETSRWHSFQRLLGRCRFPVSLGDLDQQVATWKRRKEADLIYAPCQTQTQVLAYLRYFGLWDIPLVCLAHHPVERGKLAWLRRPFVRANLLGTGRFPSLSVKVATEINELVQAPLSEPAPWGPERDYYEVAVGPGNGALAAGRTGRDFVTFGRAATAAGTSARIVCLKQSVTDAFSQFGKNVILDVHSDDRPVGYRALMRELATARVLAIPMCDGATNLAGLTSLTDALAVGRPVIITRNPHLDLDVEKLGIGRWVAPGDIAGWVDALRWFDGHPMEAMEMGRRARALVDGGLNSASFARSMIRHFDTVLKNTATKSGIV